MRIGEFSRRTGVSERLLRYYEEQGLLHPSRRSSGYREYAEEDVETVRGIRILLAVGLSTTRIAELLPCMADEGAGLAPLCTGMLPDLYEERERITTAVADLLVARDRLEEIIAATAPDEAPGVTEGAPVAVSASPAE